MTAGVSEPAAVPAVPRAIIVVTAGTASAFPAATCRFGVAAGISIPAAAVAIIVVASAVGPVVAFPAGRGASAATAT